MFRHSVFHSTSSPYGEIIPLSTPKFPDPLTSPTEQHDQFWCSCFDMRKGFDWVTSPLPCRIGKQHWRHYRECWSLYILHMLSLWLQRMTCKSMAVVPKWCPISHSQWENSRDTVTKKWPGLTIVSESGKKRRKWLCGRLPAEDNSTSNVQQLLRHALYCPLCFWMENMIHT